MKFRKHFDYDVEAASDEAACGDFGPSLTIQSQAEEADINVMMKRFGVTGQLPENVRVPTFGDFADVGDFRSALHAIMLAEDSFMQMPADVRSRFRNDPALFVDFCSDPANLGEMRRLGLAVAEVPSGSGKVEAGGDRGGGAPNSGVQRPAGDSGGGEQGARGDV